jgi:fibronectin type 3 domain-containing protein
MLTVNATSVSFGSVPISTSSTQSVTLASTGSEPVTVNSVSVTGTGFSVSGVTFPVTLAPGQSVVVNVVFAPSASGAQSGQLTVVSNSVSNPSDAISMTGTGVVAVHSVTLTWDAPVNSPDPVAGFNVYRTSSGGTSYQLLNTGLDSFTTYADYTVQSGLTYTYLVRSVDAQGVESAPSNTTTATIP